MSEAKGVLPHGESLRRAVRWLDEEVRARPAAPRTKLIDEAAARFDLSPLQVEFLLGNWGAKP
ncbi:MAG TPA: hypothetical protein VFR85_08085 [Anaeromyxobacteraceae bacterium]|nr:hypothetical protein [Anaeromyxobacteraceae bacterium]